MLKPTDLSAKCMANYNDSNEKLSIQLCVTKFVHFDWGCCCDLRSRISRLVLAARPEQNWAKASGSWPRQFHSRPSLARPGLSLRRSPRVTTQLPVMLFPLRLRVLMLGLRMIPWSFGRLTQTLNLTISLNTINFPSSTRQLREERIPFVSVVSNGKEFDKNELEEY